MKLPSTAHRIIIQWCSLSAYYPPPSGIVEVPIPISTEITIRSYVSMLKDPNIKFRRIGIINGIR